MLDLLVLDQSNPRSILFQLKGILKGLKKIALIYGACGEEQLAPLRDELLALTADTDLFCGNARLIDLLKRIRVASEAMSEHIGVQFFSHTGNHQSRAKTV